MPFVADATHTFDLTTREGETIGGQELARSR
jgi:hypothetical protein